MTRKYYVSRNSAGLVNNWIQVEETEEGIEQQNGSDRRVLGIKYLLQTKPNKREAH